MITTPEDDEIYSFMETASGALQRYLITVNERELKVCSSKSGKVKKNIDLSIQVKVTTGDKILFDLNQRLNLQQHITRLPEISDQNKNESMIGHKNQQEEKKSEETKALYFYPLWIKQCDGVSSRVFLFESKKTRIKMINIILKTQGFNSQLDQYSLIEPLHVNDE